MSPSAAAKYIVFLLIVGVSVADAETNKAYCFKFTWLGPEYDNDTIPDIQNKTCEDLKKTPPCYEPLVFSFDGTIPNTTYMWENYDRDQISCKLTRSTVCLKWVNYYDGKVENITYTCGKMTSPHGPVHDGCETWDRGAYAVKACACRTPVINGDPRIPCNVGARVTTGVWTSLFIVTSTILALRGANLRNTS